MGSWWATGGRGAGLLQVIQEFPDRAGSRHCSGFHRGMFSPNGSGKEGDETGLGEGDLDVLKGSSKSGISSLGCGREELAVGASSQGSSCYQVRAQTEASSHCDLFQYSKLPAAVLLCTSWTDALRQQCIRGLHHPEGTKRVRSLKEQHLLPQ